MKREGILDDKYIDNIQDISFTPVFILGLHRSGTSILYKMLAESNQFNSVTAYHILKYDQLLYNSLHHLEEQKKEELLNLFLEKGISTRKTDHIKVTPDYAHEYMYIFSERDYPWRITRNNQWLFDELCKKNVFISKNNLPILLKNPYDFPNFLLIHQMYPHAKFIFIHRHPFDVISSTMRLWKTLLESKNEYTALFSKRYVHMMENPLLCSLARWYYISRFPPGIFEVIHRSKKACRHYLNNIEKLPSESFIWIQYETLCKNPNDVIYNIFDFLHMSTDKDYSGYIKPRKLKIIPEVKRMKNFIYRRMKSYFEYFNYTLD
jgi:hypothetical protein